MTTTQPLNLNKPTATNKAAIAFAVVLAISGAVPMEAQSYVEAQQVVEKCTCETSIYKDVDTVFDHAAVQQQEIEKAERLSREFQQLVQQWRSEKGAVSLYAQVALRPSYQFILAMGPDVIPLIFAQLESEGNAPDHIWFWALAALTHDNPVPAKSRGRVLEMTKAWLEWGNIKGYVQMV
jgi:hypothetical protein